MPCVGEDVGGGVEEDRGSQASDKTTSPKIARLLWNMLQCRDPLFEDLVQRREGAILRCNTGVARGAGRTPVGSTVGGRTTALRCPASRMDASAGRAEEPTVPTTRFPVRGKPSVRDLSAQLARKVGIDPLYSFGRSPPWMSDRPAGTSNNRTEQAPVRAGPLGAVTSSGPRGSGTVESSRLHGNGAVKASGHGGSGAATFECAAG